MKILIGFDGSKDAEQAIRQLPAAGLPAKAQALVLTVTSPWTPGGKQGAPSLRKGEAGRIAEAALREAESLVAKAAGMLKASFPGWKVTGEAVIDAPAVGLLTRAESWKPDLIVLGCHGRTAFGRLLMGSVSRQVMHHAPCDVRITRPGEAEGKAPKVLVAVDGSAGSDHAVSAAASRHWPKGTRIRVVAALEGIGLTDALRGIKDSLLGGGKDIRKAWVEKKSEAAAMRLAAPGVRVTTSVKVGDPRLVILREARDWEADCIVVGSRGLAGIERFLLGSVSSAVAAHAPCTVEVIRKRRGARRSR